MQISNKLLQFTKMVKYFKFNSLMIVAVSL